MDTEENDQSADFNQSHGTDDDLKNDHDDDEQGSSLSPSGQLSGARRSRFFRSRRKQRLPQETVQALNSNSDGSSESSIYSSESPEQSGEEKSDESIINEESTNSEDKTPKEGKPHWRVTSPPPQPSNDDDTDTSSTSEESKLSTSMENPDNTTKAAATKSTISESSSLALPRPTIYAGYQRKKSQSVKLTRIDPIDSCPKKAVRFADDFGLDLSQVKMIKSDELPHVPSAAFKDLCISRDDGSSNSNGDERTKSITYLEQLFENPIHSNGFDDRVQRHKIVLEQANAIDNRIYGTIKLLSLGMNKHVRIRLTTDNWFTHDDYDAAYIPNSFDGTFDRFSFTMEIDRDRICVGNNIQFCICYETFIGQDFWDSNYQQNYRFDCISRIIPDYSSFN